MIIVIIIMCLTLKISTTACPRNFSKGENRETLAPISIMMYFTFCSMLRRAFANQWELKLFLECIFSLTKRSIRSFQMFSSPHLYQGFSIPSCVHHHIWGPSLTSSIKLQGVSIFKMGRDNIGTLPFEKHNLKRFQKSSQPMAGFNGPNQN